LGHEGVGVVESVGSGVPSSYKKGDHVLLTYAACERCPHCLQGKPSYCLKHGEINFSGVNRHGEPVHSSSAAMSGPLAGIIHGSFFQQSSFATHALVTAQNTLKVDSSLPLHTLAPLGCGVQTGAGAVLNSLKVHPGASIAIFGCGAVGLSAVLAAARIAHASTVIAVDLSESRLALARSFGATQTLRITGNETSADLATRLKQLAGTTHGLDFALDTSGNKNALRAGFEALKSMGTAALVGGSASSVEIDMGALLHGKSVRGIVQGDSVPHVFIPRLIDAWRTGIFPFDQMIRYYDGGLAALNQATAESKDPNSGVIKPVLRLE
jgi:aryl-alcohol dehydrogenase